MEADPIRHVVLLILENHSFDQMLGSLQEIYPDLEGVDPATARINYDDEGRAYEQAPTEERQMLLDPHHEVPHVAIQLKGRNSGFVKDFAQSYPESTPAARRFIMGYYPRGFLPALHTLAEAFTICDHWHASLPGPTWPNRFFALSGTSHGRVNMPGDGTHGLDLSGYMQQTQDTIFDRLNERGIHWKDYFHDVPQTTVFSHQRDPANAARYFYIPEFFRDARGDEGEFPEFSLIEPSYMGWGQNDDHPPFDVMRAEKLTADVYNALRGNKELWESTLLVVMFDEHGGFYDHVVPPAAVPPDDHQEEYAFDQLGVRVPALLISPWVDQRVEHTLFDHTSVLKYLIEKWSLGPLGRRSENASSIGLAITRESVRTDTPERIALTAAQLAPPDPEAEEKAFDNVNPHQQALAALTRYLKDEAVEELPKLYAGLSRVLASLESWLHGIVERLSRIPGTIRVSFAEPDRLAHHIDASPKDGFARYLMQSKRKAVGHVARQLRSREATHEQRRHAQQTLALLTGRQYHREQDGQEHAESWLRRHGQ